MAGLATSSYTHPLLFVMGVSGPAIFKVEQLQRYKTTVTGLQYCSKRNGIGLQNSIVGGIKRLCTPDIVSMCCLKVLTYF